MLYDARPGQIIDAFSLKVGPDRVEKIFIINSVEVRSSLVEPNSSGKFYAVEVFDLFGDTLRHNQRASDWFGTEYSFLSDGRKVIYKFPYQSRKDVQRAINSKFALLMISDESIPARVKYKAHLFTWANIRGKTKKYLIKGDRVTVGKARLGWCEVNYSGATQTLEMWVMCSALEPEKQTKKRNAQEAQLNDVKPRAVHFEFSQ